MIENFLCVFLVLFWLNQKNTCFVFLGFITKKQQVCLPHGPTFQLEGVGDSVGTCFKTNCFLTRFFGKKTVFLGKKRFFANEDFVRKFWVMFFFVYNAVMWCLCIPRFPLKLRLFFNNILFISRYKYVFEERCKRSSKHYARRSYSKVSSKILSFHFPKRHVMTLSATEM